MSAERECESLEKNYDGVIVPLYPKIQIVYNDVLEFFKGYVEQGLYSGTDEIVVRVFLTSGNTFREYVREETDAFERYMPGYTDFLLRLEMPRFVWVVETATCRQYLDGYISSFMLLDSTSSTVNPSPAIHFFQVADSGSDESIIPRFKHNLKEYGRKLQ